MRARTFAVIASLVIPTLAQAQRIPDAGTIRRRGPAQPAPLPPQPEPIARAVAYKRWNLSIESYPLVSWVRAPGYSADGSVSGWTSVGAGTRGEYRLAPNVSATLDLTSTLFGGPANVYSAELGARFRPDRSERRLYPFIDARFGYIATSSADFSSSYQDPFGTSAIRGVNAPSYSRGFGAIVGTGAEYDLTSTLALTTSISALRTRLTSHVLQSGQFVDPSFTMTAVRYSIGIRYNPIQILKAVGPGQL